MSETRATISDKAWGPYLDANRSKLPPGCYAYVGDRGVKATWLLPHHEGAGAVGNNGLFAQVGPLNRNGVHAAAGRFSSTQFPNAAARKSAARHLVAAYGTLKEEPPQVLKDAAGRAVEPDEYDTPSDFAGRATISPSEQLTPEAAAGLLKTINSKHARSPLTLDQVYLFPGVLSTQAIDYYGTRMAASSIKNYLADVKQGLPLMNSHRTGGLFAGSAELPVGRIFESAIEGDLLKTGKASFDQQPGASLGIWSYMLRGMQAGDTSTNDLATGIDGGVIKDLSIGFSTRPDGQFLCSICGKDYMGRATGPDEQPCQHVTFMEYDGQRAFVWVEGAHAVEGSLVYQGATPGAMIRKAQAEAIRLPAERVEWLEEHYQVRLLDRATFPVSKIKREEVEQVLNRDGIIEVLEDYVEAERVTAICAQEDDEAFVQEAVDELAGRIATAQAGAVELNVTIRDLTAQAEGLKIEAEIGRTYRDDLVSVAVAARVRAQGNGFNAEKYRAVLVGSNDLDFIKSEGTAWEERASTVLRGGPGQTRKAGEEKEAPKAPVGAYQ